VSSSSLSLEDGVPLFSPRPPRLAPAPSWAESIWARSQGTQAWTAASGGRSHRVAKVTFACRVVRHERDARSQGTRWGTTGKDLKANP